MSTSCAAPRRRANAPAMALVLCCAMRAFSPISLENVASWDSRSALAPGSGLRSTLSTEGLPLLQMFHTDGLKEQAQHGDGNTSTEKCPTECQRNIVN